MKFCFIVGSMNIGGVQAFIINLARYLKSCGDEVTVITTKDHGNWWYKLDEEQLTGVFLPESDFMCPATHAFSMAKFINKEQFDVVFLNHAREAQIAIPLYRSGVKIFPVLHNDTNGIVRMALRNSKHWDILVAVSPRLVRRVASHLVERKFIQINYPVEMPDDVGFANRNPWRPDLELLFVGRLHEQQKGVMLLPQIIRACHAKGLNVTMKIIGDGDDKKCLREAFEKNGTLNTVHFYSECSSKKTIEQMLHAHVLIMPSHYEGLGIVAVEAQASGCVPLASRLSGVTDHSIQDGKSGYLIDDHNAISYVNHIKELSASRPLWESMSKAGRENVLNNFSIQSMGAKYRETVGNSVINRQRESAFEQRINFLRGLSYKDWVPNKLKNNKFVARVVAKRNEGSRTLS